MISKELLSEVIGTSARDVRLSNNTLICLVGNGSEYRVNIYELQNLCKEWAFSNKKEVTSGLMEATVFYQVFDTHYEVWRNVDKEFKAKSEPEAVFLACQWILENKDN